MFKTMLNLLAIFVVAVNIISAYEDGFNNRHKSGAANPQDAMFLESVAKTNGQGYEAIIIVNLVLMVGILFNRQLLIATWIVVYAFILALSSIQSIVENKFPWTPGISVTAAMWMRDHFHLDHSMMAVAATSLTLTCFLLVFMVFMFKGLMKISDAPPLSRRPLPPLPMSSSSSRAMECARVQAMAEAIRDQMRRGTTSPLFTSTATTSLSDTPPAYSDLEGNQSSQPPLYEDAMKQGVDPPGTLASNQAKLGNEDATSLPGTSKKGKKKKKSVQSV